MIDGTENGSMSALHERIRQLQIRRQLDVLASQTQRKLDMMQMQRRIDLLRAEHDKKEMDMRRELDAMKAVLARQAERAERAGAEMHRQRACAEPPGFGFGFGSPSFRRDGGARRSAGRLPEEE